jgi:hypothetical protein
MPPRRSQEQPIEPSITPERARSKKKATYIVEHDVTLKRPVYQDIWDKAQVVI